MLKMALVVTMTAVLPSAAFALPCAAAIGCGHPAPAPFLAAGIPAFAALGGGALVARLVRRMCGRTPTAATPSESATEV
jgi:hypothetical protein